MYIRDQVIVLKKRPYREYDRQYVMYGRKHGLLLATARGAVKPKAKQASQLEPLGFAEVMIAKGRNFDHLAVASSLFPGRRIEKLGGLAVAGAFADLCLSLVRPGVADERIFNLWDDFSDCLARLPQEPTSTRAKLLFAAAGLKLMDVLGYGPALRLCGSCRRPPGPTDAWFSSELNALVCADCVRERRDSCMLVKAHAVTFARYMRDAGFDSILSVAAPIEVAQGTLRIIQESWKHAPLEREPHGMETIQAMLQG